MPSVIKPGHAFKFAPRLAAIDLADHLAEAEKFLADARTQSRAILAQGRREAAAGLQVAQKQGHQEGCTRGHEEGLAAGRTAGLEEAKRRFEAELGSLQSVFNNAISGFENSKRDLLSAARQDVLEFAISLAHRVVKRVGACDRGAAAANLEEALRLIGAATDVVVRAHPSDVESLQRFAEGLARSAADCRHVAIEADPELSPGGCVVRASATRIDATLETQIDEIARLLLGDRGQTQGGEEGASSPA